VADNPPLSNPPFSLAVYRALVRAAAPFAGVLLALRRRRGKEHGERLCERRGIATCERGKGPLIWVHGASVGETLSILPLIEELSGREPALFVLLTSGTVSSAELVQARAPRRMVHQFVPLDVPEFIERFLDFWRPQVALFVESELWPNTIRALKRRGLATVLVNARMSARSSRRWRRAPATVRWLLESFDLCLAQSEGDARRLTALGAPAVQVTGNLKFDVPAPPAEPRALAALREAIGARPVFVAASTHPGEDGLIAEAHRELARAVPGLLTIIAPRHPGRGPAIAEEIAGMGLAVRLRSRDGLPGADTGVYVADTFGELGLLYRVSEVVFIGGSLVPHGGQNPIESAKLGAAILHGPHIFNFAEIYALLDAEGGGREVSSRERLVEAAGTLLADKAARHCMIERARSTVRTRSGALARTLDALRPYLPAGDA
jgi:3-deoxy-D-manno-octulosonic-acid transferase